NSPRSPLESTAAASSMMVLIIVSVTTHTFFLFLFFGLGNTETSLHQLRLREEDEFISSMHGKQHQTFFLQVLVSFGGREP
ncbi:hypothetical protein INR49_005973, partial [Caranx melampygus]